MMVYLFGGPGDGRSFDAYQSPPHVVYQEDMFAPMKYGDGDPTQCAMPPRHHYARINGDSPFYGHDCHGTCGWPDIPTRSVRFGDGIEVIPVSELQVWLRNWADTAITKAWEECAGKLIQAVTDYRIAHYTNPTELKLSPADWEMGYRNTETIFTDGNERPVRKFHPREPIPDHGILFGFPASVDHQLVPGQFTVR